MEDTKLLKTCDTCTRVLQTLLLLTKQPMSVQEILNYFKETEKEFYTSEVILKYINTLKVFGFRFIKNGNKYILLNEIHEISFNDNDFDCFLKMFEMAKDVPQAVEELTNLKEKLVRKFDNATRLRASNYKFPKYLDIKPSNLVKQLEKICADKQKVKVTYTLRKKDITVELVPLEVKYEKQYVYFSCYSTKTAQILDIKVSLIKEVEQLPNKIVSDALLLSPVLFKLKDRLAKTYKLKNGEILFQTLDDGSVIISNSNEDRNKLLYRLMRYGSLCELVSPKTMRDDMQSLISRTLNNYR